MLNVISVELDRRVVYRAALRFLLMQRLQLRFDRDSTALRLFDDFVTIVYLPAVGSSTTWLRLAGYVNLMTLDKQANGRRTAVESKSNRSIFNFSGYFCEATYVNVRKRTVGAYVLSRSK